VRTVLLLLALWGSVSIAALRRWWHDRAVDRRDQQLRALLAGVVVPAPRPAADDSVLAPHAEPRGV
jgi:hypothetical protein